MKRESGQRDWARTFQVSEVGGEKLFQSHPSPATLPEDARRHSRPKLSRVARSRSVGRRAGAYPPRGRCGRRQRLRLTWNGLPRGQRTAASAQGLSHRYMPCTGQQYGSSASCNESRVPPLALLSLQHLDTVTTSCDALSYHALGLVCEVEQRCVLSSAVRLMTLSVVVLPYRYSLSLPAVEPFTLFSLSG